MAGAASAPPATAPLMITLMWLLIATHCCLLPLNKTMTSYKAMRNTIDSKGLEPFAPPQVLRAQSMKLLLKAIEMITVIQ
jgi:hypothetical protein